MPRYQTYIASFRRRLRLIVGASRGMDTLTELEVRSLLKEIRAIGKLSLAGALPHDVLARVHRIMQQAVQETRSTVEGALGHGTKNRMD